MLLGITGKKENGTRCSRLNVIDLFRNGVKKNRVTKWVKADLAAAKGIINLPVPAVAARKIVPAPRDALIPATAMAASTERKSGRRDGRL